MAPPRHTPLQTPGPEAEEPDRAVPVRGPVAQRQRAFPALRRAGPAAGKREFRPLFFFSFSFFDRSPTMQPCTIIITDGEEPTGRRGGDGRTSSPLAHPSTGSCRRGAAPFSRFGPSFPARTLQNQRSAAGSCFGLLNGRFPLPCLFGTGLLCSQSIMHASVVAR